MGHHFDLITGGSPFVPKDIAFPKKKARELHEILSGLSLSEAQEIIAHALGWPGWFALHQALKHGSPPSLPDEEVSLEETRRRYGNQMMALLNARVAVWQVEQVVAELALTCSHATASQRRDAVGPWGAFQEDVEEVFPGVISGQCSKFECYRLSPEREAEVLPHLRLDTNGWYMLDDHKWRVVLSFPQYFSAEEYAQAEIDFAYGEPLVYELVMGAKEEDAFSPELVPTMATRRDAALAQPDAWFALCVKPFAAFEDEAVPPEGSLIVHVAGAIKGSALLQLMDAKGVWPEASPPESAWFGLETSEADEVLGTFRGKGDTRLSGRKGWALPRIASRPFVRSPFSPYELDLLELTPPSPVLTKPVRGQPVLIP